MAQSVTWQVRELDGTTVRLDLTDPDHYTTRVWERAGVQRVREVATSRTVDDEFDVSVRRGPEQLRVTLAVADDTMPHVTYRTNQLEAAVSTPFILVQFTTYGITTAWRCRPADIATSTGREDHTLCRRLVNLIIPANPAPTVTGAVAP